METIDPAKASSTTLHLDALLQAGRARAEAEGRALDPDSAKVRPTSMMSEYTSEPLNNSAAATPKRPGHVRVKSFFSARSQETADSREMESSVGHDEEDEEDKAMLAARRAQGRQRSLAAINLAAHRAQEADDDVAKRAEEAAQRMADDLLSPMDEVYRPLQTPAEVSLPIMNGSITASTPRTFGGESRMTGQASDASQHVVSPTITVEPILLEPEVQVETENSQAREVPPKDETQVELEEVQSEEAGDQTILDELVSHHSHTNHDEAEQEGLPLSGDYGGYDYAEEMEEGEGETDYTHLPLPAYHEESSRRESLPRHLPQLNIDPRLSFGGFSARDGEMSRRNTMLEEDVEGNPTDKPDIAVQTTYAPDREAHIRNTRSINGSFAVSTMSENESEVGQVYEAVKRNVSIKVPSRLLPLNGEQPAQAAGSPPKRRDSNFNPSYTTSQGLLSVNSIASARRPSLAPSVTPPKEREGSFSSRTSMSRRGSGVHATGLGMRRESSNPPVPSPLRSNLPATVEMPDEPISPLGARVIQKKSSFSFATPGSPLKIKTALPPRPTVSPGVSPRTATSAKLQLPSTSPAAEVMARIPSNGPTSSLRNQVRPRAVSPAPSTDSEHAPGLAPSIASDSASSDGHLESPPVGQFPLSITGRKDDTFGPAYGGLKHAAISPDWIPDQTVTQVHFLQTDPNPQVMGRARVSISRASSSDDHHSMTSHETSNSILPGVRSKIAQMESREEALRKFSVASIASNHLPPQASPPMMAMPVPFGSPRIPSGRRHYTSALAPRPQRQVSDDTPNYLDTLGGTTYIRPRAYRDSTPGALEGHLDPFGLGVKRKTSVSSTSTTATAIEVALGRQMGPRVQGYGAGVVSPRQRELPRIPLQSRVSEELIETDSSEGML